MKDSIGNLLPEGVGLNAGAKLGERLRALTVNSFLLAVEVALINGKTVIYDATLKEAAITDQDGQTYFASHH